MSDFELQVPSAAFTQSTRDTSYSSQTIDDLDFERSEQTTKYGSRIKSLFGKNILPTALDTRATTTPPASGATSPTKSLRSFITTNSNISSASKASTRARTTSRILFDNFFTGNSNQVELGVSSLGGSSNSSRSHSRSHSRSYSRSRSVAIPTSEDEYDAEGEGMEKSYTRTPTGTRPRRSPTTESATATYSRLGSWFGGNTKSSTPSTPTSPLNLTTDDPLLTLDIQHALFPHGPVDPLNPTSFNDLLAAAEATILTYQNAYRQLRVSELPTLQSELALKEDEIEECETRAQHLKMQLQDLGEQCTAQAQKADVLETMLREKCEGENCSASSGSRRGSRVIRPGSDSGFESDGDSVFSEAQHAIVGNTKSRDQHAAAIPSQSMFSSNMSRENHMLRLRVEELESSVDDCLSLVSGLGR